MESYYCYLYSNQTNEFVVFDWIGRNPPAHKILNDACYWITHQDITAVFSEKDEFFPSNNTRNGNVLSWDKFSTKHGINVMDVIRAIG